MAQLTAGEQRSEWGLDWKAGIIVAALLVAAQALILRLKTERGELAPLGHPDYGTRHLALVGEPNTETNRNLLKLHVLEALRQEPRLERIVRIDVRPVPGNERRGEVRIELELLARSLPDPLILVVPFSFEGPI